MRQKLVIFSVVLLALAAVAVGRETQTAQAAGTTPWPSGGQQVAEYPGVDYLQVVSQQCLPGNRVRINLNWQAYNLGPQWVDLSLFNNGWQWGTFIGLGPLPAWQSNFTWDGLLPGYWHVLRVNTATNVGWFPSQTISFFTRTDCATQIIDSDGDGVPNNVDACPNQWGLPQYAGCPAPTPPPPPPVVGNCEYTNNNGWCPGDPPPADHCPDKQVQILIFPPPKLGCVWTPDPTYTVGSVVTICYWVNQPMYVSIQSQLPNGQVRQVTQGNDDGNGNCLRADAAGQPLTTGLPLGQRTTRLYTLNSELLDDTTWNVVQ